MKFPTFPPQDSAAARLLQDINEAGTLYPLVHELPSAHTAATELDRLGWHIDVDFLSARGRIGPARPGCGQIGFTIGDRGKFFDWCDSAEGQRWLADIPANAEATP